MELLRLIHRNDSLRRSGPHGWAGLGLVAILLLAGLGCRDGSAQADADRSTQQTALRSEKNVDDASPAAAVPSPSADSLATSPVAVESLADEGPIKKEVWDVQSIQGKRVGYAHTVVREVTQAGEKLELTRQESVLSMVREGQPIKQTVRLAVWETRQGQLRHFQTEMSSAGSQVQAKGTVQNGKLIVETTTLGKTSIQTIPWKELWGGFFAAERSLADKPLEPGENRSVWGLLPIFHVPAETALAAGDFETVAMPGGEQRLLKISSRIQIGDQAIQSVAWMDEQGETVKTLIPGLQQESVRSTREDALGDESAAPLDLIAASVVPLQGTLPNPPLTQRVVYRATINDGQIENLFDDCLSQHVRVEDEQTAILEVIAVRPGQPEQPGKQQPPTDEDTAPNNLVQSDDVRIVQMAASVAADETDPWKLACALERHVHNVVQKKNFSQAFATAAEVAQSREGDCTEHAVLLAGLCRARKLPARVAFGLVYYPPQKGFAYHMWNEVWIDDRWIPLDATLGNGGIGSDHVKLADSSLQGSTAYSAMLPVIQVFGRLKLEVVEAE